MTRPAIGSRLAAATYGLWAGLCVLVSYVIVAALTADNPRQVFNILRDFCLPYVIPTGFVAFLGWMLLHRRGRQPGRWSYAALAVGIVVTIHLVLVLAMTGSTDFFINALLGLPAHGWFTVPVALAATYLFVWWLKRDARA